MNSKGAATGDHWLPLPFVVAVVLCAGLASSSHAQADGKAGKGKERKAQLVSTAVLGLYEAREFEGVKYRLLKPIDLPENPGKKYPMILSLHGAAGTGDDNVRNLREWNTVMAQEELRRKHPCFVVVPQSVGPWRTPAMAEHYTDEKIAKMSKDWQEVVASRRKLLQDPKGGNLDRVFLLLDALAREFPIDADRVYVLGHSMGGFGTWTAVAEQPGRFAAAITSAGWLGPWLDTSAVKDVPIWSFQGARDKTSQVSMGNSTFKRMKAIGAKVKFTELANHGHNVNEAAFAYTGDTKANGGVTKYASERCDQTADVWVWLFGQKRAAKRRMGGRKGTVKGAVLDEANIPGETRDAVASLYPTAEEARITCAIVDAAAKVRDLSFKYLAEGKGATVTARFGKDGITICDPNRASEGAEKVFQRIYEKAI